MFTSMLSMLNYQSQVIAVSYSLMKTCIKDECKTYIQDVIKMAFIDRPLKQQLLSS